MCVSDPGVWKVSRTSAGVIRNLEKKKKYVNHYSFHIMDPTWGHLTIKMSGHPPFGAQVILNGHEYVACQAQSADIGFNEGGQLLHPGRRSETPETLRAGMRTLFHDLGISATAA